MWSRNDTVVIYDSPVTPSPSLPSFEKPIAILPHIAGDRWLFRDYRFSFRTRKAVLCTEESWILTCRERVWERERGGRVVGSSRKYIWFPISFYLFPRSTYRTHDCYCGNKFYSYTEQPLYIIPFDRIQHMLANAIYFPAEREYFLFPLQTPKTNAIRIRRPLSPSSHRPLHLRYTCPSRDGEVTLN